MAAPASIMRNAAAKQDNSAFEQEQDANSALSDLDRGLRSMKNGVQCESVVRFPRLFEKYPFPILINSAFLRLADVFRAGNNFIRWCILRVTQQSEKHLDKVLNVEEFMRRIFTVYHSNDPVARAITLRTLGSIAMIISERKNVHHSIVVSLDSHDAVEVDAAIYAAEQFSEKSSVFATNICDKISEMINSIATPVDLKLALIPILKHMHHDVGLVSKARKVCLSLLSSYPAEKFVTLTLQTMSHLAALSLIDIQTQVALLLTHLEKDPRWKVKVVILQELQKLAKKAPHLWSYDHVQSLCIFVQSTPYTGMKIGVLNVLTTLSKSVAFKIFFSKYDFHSNFLDVCNLCYQFDNASLVSKAIEFYTDIAVAYSKIKSTEYWCGQNLIDGAVTAIQTQILVGAAQSEPNEQAALKLCLRCAIELVKTQPKSAETFVTCISSLLLDMREPNGSLLCQCLAGIGSVSKDLLPKSVIPELLSVLDGSVKSLEDPTQFEVYLCTVLFQAADGKAIPDHVCQQMIDCCDRANPWLTFKLARQALRFGQCGIAEHLFNSLAQKVSSEHFYFWLTGLRDICSAEKRLQTDGDVDSETVRNISDALTYYHKGVTALKAAVIPSFPLQFQCEYVQLRASLLEVHSQLIRTCNTFRTCPPPAIASALALANGQEITRCGQIVTQLTKCSNEYSELSERFANLYQMSFDADSTSLHNVLQHSELIAKYSVSMETLLHDGLPEHQLCGDLVYKFWKLFGSLNFAEQFEKMSCELMILAINSITLASQEGQGLLADKMMVGIGESSPSDAFHNRLLAVHKELGELLQTVGTHKITFMHMEFLTTAACRLTPSLIPFPRYFFQSLQQTAVKLAISPQQTTSVEPVLVQTDTHLTLKVEGVIQHGSQPGLFRKIHSISITVDSVLVNKTHNSDQKATESIVNNLTQSVEPHNDYFSLSFILGFPVAGAHQVNIQAAIIDENGCLWKTGLKVGLQVKSFDDALQRQQAKMPSRPSFSQLFTS